MKLAPIDKGYAIGFGTRLRPRLRISSVAARIGMVKGTPFSKLLLCVRKSLRASILVVPL